MSKQAVLNRKTKFNAETTKVLKWLMVKAAYLVTSAVVSGGTILGGLSPFGASFCAAVPYNALAPSLIGSLVGYTFSSPAESFRYMAVVMGIGGIRWVLNDLKIANTRIFPALASFIPIAATGVVLLTAGSETLEGFTACMTEAIIASAAAYFFKQTLNSVRSKKAVTAWSSTELAMLVISGCILLLSVSSISLNGFYPARVLSILIILVFARYGSVSGGCICGTAFGMVFSLAQTGDFYISGAYAFGGLMAGLFAPVGKICSALAFALSAAVISLCAGEGFPELMMIFEFFCSAALFMVIPNSTGSFISSVFSNDMDSHMADALRENVVSRLSFASKALEGVSSCVTGVSERLQRIYTPSIEGVYQKAANEACQGCGLRVFCTEKEGDVTKDDFNRLTPLLKEKGEVTARDIEKLFVKKCCKNKELAESINRNYKDYLASVAADKRITQIRSVVAGQFSGLGNILNDLSIEFDNICDYDCESASRVCAAVEGMGIVPMQCSCRIDMNSKMTVEIEMTGINPKELSRARLLREVSRSCMRRFDSPCISVAEDRIRAVFNELPEFDVQIGTSQHICGNSTLCGDCVNYFTDGTGKMTAVLSDGMGTGGRAAVDSNMAVSIMTKLCRSGLSCESALQIVNSSVMIKSEEESLATLDVTSVNLFSGEVDIMKAGAPLTYIKRKGRVTRLDMPSLPVGILNNVKFSKERIKLSEGDWVLMVSDGALFGNDSWIEDLLAGWNEGHASKLAKEVISGAESRRNDGHDDDISAIAIKLIHS